MRISAWATVVAIGFTGAIMAPGCVVGSDDDDPNTDAGAGTGGSGGSTGGSAGTGGRGGTAGTGGASGRGGAGGSGGSLPIDCSPADAGTNVCIECMKRNCCAELSACAADTDCAGMDGEGELTCIQDCALAVVADGGVVSDSVLASCAGQCATGSTVAETTNDAIACMNTGARLDGGSGADCHVDCLSGD